VRPSRPMFAARRRLGPGAFGLTLLLGVVPVLFLVSPSGPLRAETTPAPPQAAARPASGEDRTPAEEVTGQPDTDPFATVDRVRLHLPGTDGEVVLVGFHEASSRASRAFTPLGRLRDHQNTTKFDPPADDPDGPAYVVLSSRGRPFPATSAIDVVVREGAAVRSPVDGTVTDVRAYQLYGRYPDQRIEIAPDAAPDQRIVMIHLDEVVVRPGDRVAVGDSVVARGARLLPFGSHIDRYTEPDRHPHVHYEIKHADDAGDG
jgi:murein DD-endopeptidase MepM/ murein hydrolase activator NlpD